MINHKNGYTDFGKPVSNRVCPNCKSSNYTETVSREYCHDCGLACDYWGRGPNEIYLRMMEVNARIERDRREQEYEEAEREGWHC